VAAAPGVMMAPWQPFFVKWAGKVCNRADANYYGFLVGLGVAGNSIAFVFAETRCDRPLVWRAATV